MLFSFFTRDQLVTFSGKRAECIYLVYFVILGALLLFANGCMICHIWDMVCLDAYAVLPIFFYAFTRIRFRY